MTIAFHGEATAKAALLARLRCHAEMGTLTFGATRWDGVSGTPMGVSAESEDARDYAERFGYPLPLAALLDIVMTCVPPDRALDEALAWVECVEPGADMATVPWQIANDLLVRLRADKLATTPYLILHDLHGRDVAGTSVSRAQWAAQRTAIEAAATAADGERRGALEACLIACWSLRTSRSVLVELVNRWRRSADPHSDPDAGFGEADHRRAVAILETIWTETQVARDGGEAVDIPSLFRARHPDLAAGFEANLARGNALFQARSREIPALVRRHMAAVGRATDIRNVEVGNGEPA